jgi:hypothetical protein
MGVEMNAEARARVDKHLDAVESAMMKGGATRDERRAVVDDLEAQIREMVSQRGAGAAEDVEEVLRELDPPQAYGGSEEGRGWRRRAVRRGRGKEQRGWMRPGVAMLLIICGLVLLLTPVAVDYLHMRAEADMKAHPANSNYLWNPMSDEKRACFTLLGLAVGGLGVASELSETVRGWWRQRAARVAARKAAGGNETPGGAKFEGRGERA